MLKNGKKSVILLFFNNNFTFSCHLKALKIGCFWCFFRAAHKRAATHFGQLLISGGTQTSGKAFRATANFGLHTNERQSVSGNR